MIRKLLLAAVLAVLVSVTPTFVHDAYSQVKAVEGITTEKKTSKADKKANEEKKQEVESALDSGVKYVPGKAVEGVSYAKPWQLNFGPSASPVKEKLHGMHDFLLIICFAVSIFVLALLLYTCVRFSRKNNPTPSKTTHNVLIEVIWTVVPVIILIAILIPSWRLINYMDTAKNPEITLKAIGYQWYWGYEYMDGIGKGIKFEAVMKKDNELKEGEPRLLEPDNRVVLPVDTDIRILTTGADVIHAFAVPAFGVKIDAVPGRLNETWVRITKPGVYYGQCSELCGSAHAFMPIAVDAVSKEEYVAWVKEKGGELEPKLEKLKTIGTNEMTYEERAAEAKKNK